VHASVLYPKKKRGKACYFTHLTEKLKILKEDGTYGRRKTSLWNKEWAPYNFTFMHGCSNDCVYCYAKAMSIRFKRKTAETWRDEEPASLEGRSYRKKHGPIMLPSSHDITPGTIEIALQVMENSWIMAMNYCW